MLKLIELATFVFIILYAEYVDFVQQGGNWAKAGAVQNQLYARH